MDGKRAAGLKASKIDIRSLDEQLGRHLDRLCEMEEKKKTLHDQESNKVTKAGVLEAKKAESWAIKPEKLILKKAFARGAFGSVLRGIYDGQDVAVKIVDFGGKTSAERDCYKKYFEQKVSLWHNLDHPNITRFIGATMKTSELKFQIHNEAAGKEAGCVISEYVSGGTLGSYLRKHRGEKKLPLKTVKQLALDVARGLTYMHSKKIVHRDIKPENLLLNEKGRVKIADFGVSRLEAWNSREMTGYTGTPGYMAPEVLESKPYTKSCDTYGFGICLWEIYTCKRPYPNMKFDKMTSAVVYKNLRPHIPDSCPNSLGEIIKRCWDSEPRRRPSMKEVVSMLEAVDTSDNDTSPPRCFCFPI